ncbi:MAG: CCA tRNA nucleotidyltransferase [Ignavibacteria bacterium]|nr:CCA tRNA nucleotidyltransferase [Ignavibacteria bacterium]
MKTFENFINSNIVMYTALKLMKTYKRFILEKNIPTYMPIPKDIEQIARLFHNAGKDLFVVGGAVRDFLQGKQPHDFDIVTNAQPEETKQILKGWNVSDEQGKNFGVLRIYTKDEPKGYEIATYRKDIAKGRDVKGDEQKVEIGSHITINDDVKRRDLTINALFYDINKKEIVDLVGGVNDLKNNVIRAVGDPKERFDEDRLRILRVLRFAARTGGNIDQTTSNAIKEDNRLRGIGPKDDVSQERIHEEWNKMLEHAQKANSSKMMQNYIDLLTEYDMWKQMFPGMIVDTTIEVESLNNAIIFYGLFNKDDIAGKKKMMVRDLKFTIDLVNQLDFLETYKISKLEDVYRLAKLKEKFHIDEQLIRDFVDEYGLNIKFMEAFLKYCNDGFIVDGNDLMAQGFKGKAIETEKERRELIRFKNEYIMM